MEPEHPGTPPTGDPADEVGPHPDRVRSRADLLPEESSVGSDDPSAQAEIILEDSVARTEDPGAAPTTFLEHRSSDETV